MITLTDTDKRWLEIIFFILCKKVFSINQKTEDIKNFINGYRWTNMFDCDTLINVLNKNMLTDTNFVPTKHEFVVAMNDPDSRLRMKKNAIRELISGTEYKYWKKDIFHAEMREEIHKTNLYPRYTHIKKFHETIFSFLLALQYLGNIIHQIKL